MRMRRVLAVASCAVAVVAVGAGSAFAGEITGNGKPLWTNTDQWGVPHTLHGNSPCAFSGQEDNQFPGTVRTTTGPRTANCDQRGRRVRLPELVGLNPGIAFDPDQEARGG